MERQILELLAAGNNKKIAGLIGRHERTFQFHRSKLFKKFAADNNIQLISIALSAGLITKK